MVPPSSKDEALACYSISREVPRSVLMSEKLLGTLDATPKVKLLPVVNFIREVVDQNVI